jgi:hypothetical protein
VIEQELGAVREPRGQKIRVRALAAAPARMDDEVLNLEEAIQPKIPLAGR